MIPFLLLAVVVVYARDGQGKGPLKTRDEFRARVRERKIMLESRKLAELWGRFGNELQEKFDDFKIMVDETQHLMEEWKAEQRDQPFNTNEILANEVEKGW